MRRRRAALRATLSRAERVPLLRSSARGLARSDHPATNSSSESGFAVRKENKTLAGTAAPGSSDPAERWPAGVERNRRRRARARFARRRDPAPIAHSLASHRAMRMNEGSIETRRPKWRRLWTRRARVYDGWRLFGARLPNQTS